MREAGARTAGALVLLLWMGAGPAGAGEADGVLARVNQVPITARELDQRVALMARDQPVPPERRGEILRQLIREELLLKAAGAAGLEGEPGVQARLEVARRQVLIDELLRRRVAAESAVSEDELRRAYLERAPMLMTETVQVSHIMVASQAEAEGIRQELLAGKDFAALARARSQDEASAERGGDLGPIAHGQTEAPFEEAAFRLKEGELSEVVHTDQGYHVLKAGPHAPALTPFEEVREQLREAVAKDKQREAVRRVLEEIERGATVEVLDEPVK